MGRITVVLADDHPLVRKGLRALLEAEPDLRVAGEAADGIEAVRLVEQLRPDVLVADLMMPGLGGLEVARQVQRRCPATRVVLLSMYNNEPYVLEALHGGAAAYVLKDSSTTEVVTAVREAAAGRRYLSPSLSERAIQIYLEAAGGASLDPYEALTPREREVLHLAAEGESSAEIASRLSISPRTAELHRARLMHKLGLHSQTDLVRYALRRGILPP